MNCVNNETSNALEEALICLYLTVALAGVIVVLINTFLSAKLPHCSQRLC